MSVHAPEHAPLQDLDDLPSLRLLPVPQNEPPYDDELPGAAGQGSPAVIPAGAPLRTLVPLRLVQDEQASPPPAPAVDLPPVRPAAQALVQGLLEVVAGVRPVAQLKRATSTELFEALELRLQSRARATAGRRPLPGAVRSLHVQQRADVAEVCATVARGGRAGALALRLEGVGGQWRCTEVAGL